MRTRRAQRRRAKLRAKPSPGSPRSFEDLPDPFPNMGEDLERLIEEERNLEGICPCCLDREAQQEQDAYERWYLEWASSGRTSTAPAAASPKRSASKSRRRPRRGMR